METTNQVNLPATANVPRSGTALARAMFLLEFRPKLPERIDVPVQTSKRGADHGKKEGNASETI
jgi:hypothetical protein